MTDSHVRIGLVLPDVMGTYGDGGNAVVLRQRLLMRGIPAEIVEITLADPVPESLDLYTLGGAEDYAQRLATRHLIQYPGLQRAAARGARYWPSARRFRCSDTGMKPRRENGSTASACWMRPPRRSRRAPSASWSARHC
ncbi:putative adenosylcobyric acid synthase [Mycobacterium kansasii]|uniref:Putative adenosylcobyric acid synthase n=1 Tax=Mycobacterium kansasii TaxID=1768 RepID=A0A1V3X1P4_MYCKA|nr:putative adenosylcobyric acid synthase [Mycobacterium kansasii]